MKVDLLQDQIQRIVESSLEGILIVQDGRAVFVNPAAVSIFGYESPSEIMAVGFVDLLAPASRPFTFHDPEGHSVGTIIKGNEEVRGMTKAGRTIDIEVNAHVVEWNGRPAVQTSIRDVSEQKKIEREQARWLWEQETLTTIDRQLVAMVDLQNVLEAISHHAKTLTRSDFAGVVLVDLQANTYSWRTMKGNLYPWTSDPAPLTEPHRIFLATKKPLIIPDFARNKSYQVDQYPRFAQEELVSVGAFALDVEERREGMLIVGFRSEHQFSGREMRLLASLAEKSSIAIANAQLYENLLQRERELERLSGARVQAQEDERRRIAREIHDGLGQMLTAIKFNLEILGDAFTPDEAESKRVEDMKNLLDRVMKEAREISYNLMPSVLDDFGLAPALQLLCEQISKRNAIKIGFLAQGLSSRLEPRLEVGLYRIAQEALNNITKHAEATEADVQIVRHPEGIRLTIEDNGKGMSLRRREIKSGKTDRMGLVGMRERTASFKGKFIIDSSPGKGTIVNVEIPLATVEGHG